MAQNSDDGKDNDILLDTAQCIWESEQLMLSDDTEGSMEPVSLNDYFDVNIKSKTRKIVYPIYILIILCSFVMIFLGIFGPSISSLISILSLCAMTWVGAIVGMIGVYLWGTVEDCVDWFKQQNNNYENSIDDLKQTRSEIRQIAKQVFDNVRDLQRESKELSTHLEAFEELRHSLQAICGDNQDLNHMLDELNDQYMDLATVISQNERASLLAIYYEVSILDREEGLSKRDYQKFLARLNQKTKQLFLNQGDFDALQLDESGRLGLEEFETILDDVIAKQERLNIQHYMNE
eukprot:367322_1